MLAVIKTGGKQYLVKEGDTLKIEKLDLEVGAKVSFETLMLSDEQGSKLEVGSPVLSSKVSAEVLAQGRAPKIEVVKYKAKSHYHRRVGHRQPFTQVKITKLV